jgi:copper chaperone CopZ
MNNIEFKLNGLTCEACVKLVTNRFKKVPGVQEVKIDLKSGETEVSSSADLDLKILAESLKGSEFSIVK